MIAKPKKKKKKFCIFQTFKICIQTRRRKASWRQRGNGEQQREGRRETRAVGRRALGAGGGRTKVRARRCLLLPLSCSDRRLAFGPRGLPSSPGNMLSSSSALFLLSPSADSRLHLSSASLKLLLPAEQSRVHINPSKKSVFNHPRPAVSLFLDAFLEGKKKKN